MRGISIIHRSPPLHVLCKMSGSKRCAVFPPTQLLTMPPDRITQSQYVESISPDSPSNGCPPSSASSPLSSMYTHPENDLAALAQTHICARQDLSSRNHASLALLVWHRKAESFSLPARLLLCFPLFPFLSGPQRTGDFRLNFVLALDLLLDFLTYQRALPSSQKEQVRGCWTAFARMRCTRCTPDQAWGVTLSQLLRQANELISRPIV